MTSERESEREERSKQKYACEQSVKKLHYDFYKAGAVKGFKEIAKFKKRLAALFEADGGGVWVAGQCLYTQYKIETSDPVHCKFKLPEEFYRQFVDTVSARSEELKKCDADTYREDCEIAEVFKDKFGREGEDTDA